MEQLTAILIDDELSSLQNLQQKLANFCPEIRVIATSQKPEEAIALLRLHKPAVVFLDIEMPKMNGFRMLDELGSYEFEIIFTTAYNHYGIDAIRISAFDYLMKPIAIAELQQTVQRLLVSKKLHTKEKLDVLRASLQDTKNQDDKIAIPSADGLEFIPIKSILHIESSANYSKLYLTGNRQMVVTRLLKDFEDMLVPYRFFRIHHSHLINLTAIQRYIKTDGGQVVLEDGTMIDISRRKKEEFLKIISA